jgi:2-amino-4-hydroxy-6-hydroxymethyldihydropteridine diphosphokinase
VLETETLVIPHPLIPQRKFVLAPLADIAPGFVHPLLG